MALSLIELLKRLTGDVPQTADARSPLQQVALGDAPVEEKPKESSLASRLFPDDPVKKQALGRSLLQAGAGMMVAGGPSRNPVNFLQAVGNGIGLGAAGYDAALDAGQKRAVEQIKLKSAQDAMNAREALLSGSGGSGGDQGDLGFNMVRLKQIWEYQVRTGDDAGARDTLGMIQKLQQEAASKGMVVGDDGKLRAADGYNETLGDTERSKAAGRVQGEEAYRQTDDIREYNLYVEQTKAAGGEPEDFTTWMRAGKAAGATKINVGSNSNKFAEESDKKAAERLAVIVEEGNAAPQMIGDMETLTELGKQIGTGKLAEFKTAVGPYADALGIKIDGLSEAQAFDAITARLAPQMRPAGAGATSDFDAKQYLKSIPSLSNTPEGNEIIASTMKAIAQNKIDASEIAARAQRGEVSWQDAEKEIRSLPNPYERFKAFQKEEHKEKTGKKTKPVEKTPSGNLQPGYVEDGYIYQGGDPSDPKNWIDQNLL